MENLLKFIRDQTRSWVHVSNVRDSFSGPLWRLWGAVTGMVYHIYLMLKIEL
jgi:hypothetical protein